MSINVKATVRDIMDVGLWSEYCEATGTNVYAVNEGLIDDSELLTLPMKIAVKLIAIMHDQPQ